MLDSFIAMIRRIIDREGMAGFMPTLLLPSLRDMRVLDGIPAEANVKSVVSSWAQEVAGPEEDFVAAYGFDPDHFILLARIEGIDYERVCPVSAD